MTSSAAQASGVAPAVLLYIDYASSICLDSFEFGHLKL